MKRWLKRLFIVIVSLFILVVGSTLLLLGTEAGVRWLAGMVQERVPDQLEIGSIEGNLLGRLQLTGIHYVGPAGDLSVGRVVLSWNPAELFGLHLHYDEITIADAEFIAAGIPEDTEEKSASVEVDLPDLELPVKFTLDQFALADVRIHSSAEGAPVVIDDAGLSLAWNDNGITIKQLTLTMPEGNLQGSGTINPVGSYPMQIGITAASTLEEAPKIKLAGEIKGDLEALNLSQELTGDITASMNFDISRVLESPAWKGTVEISDLRAELFSPETGGNLTGIINTKGDLSSATVTADLDFRDADTVEMNWDAGLDLQANLETLMLEIRDLSLKHAEAPAELKVQGTVDEQQQFDLKANWHDFQWPLNGPTEIGIPHGDLSIQGNPDDYRLTLGTSLEGQQVPPGEWNLQAVGDREQLQINKLTGNTLEGVIELVGKVTWQPGIEWQLDLTGDSINPGEMSPDWPGLLGWQISSEGKFGDEGVDARIVIDQLDGVLRELPVAGKGQVQVKTDRIDVEDLVLSSGSAKISVAGNLSQQAALDWQADVPDLADLLPDASGSIQAQGTVRGKMEQPELQFSAVADSVGLAGTKLAHIDLKGDADLSWQKPFSIVINGKELLAGGQNIASFELHGSGTDRDHAFELKAGHEMADLRLALQGGYLEEAWQGVLQALDVESRDLGKWGLRAPVNLVAGAQRAELKDFCLQQGEASLCADGHWQSEAGSQGKMSIQGFPLAMLSPWFPDAIEQVGGVFSTEAEVSMEQALKVDAKAEITSGKIDYVTESGKGSVPHEGARIDLKIDQDGLDADFRLSLDENIFSGKFQSPNLLEGKSPEETLLAGELVINAGKFDLVEVLVPEIKELDAAIDGNFKLGGNLGRPDLEGKSSLRINHALVPLAGLDLNDTNLDITARNRAITLDGLFHSPDGHMKLDGELKLDGTRNFPGRLSLKGKNFRLISLPEAQVNVSPDLLLERTPDLISLTGKAVIPSAEVLLRDVPAGAKAASGDVVLKDELEEEEEQTAPVRMDLRLVLGEKVHFIGFGLNAFIDGQLTVRSEPGRQIMGSGEIRIEQGTFRAYGQDLDIEKGIVSFPGGPISKPGINIRASRTIGEVVAGINAIGPASKPRLTTFSTPPMAERDVISYLLIGTSASGASGGAKLSVGRQINSKLSVAVGTDVKTGEAEFITRYRINRKIHAELTTSSESSAGDLFYTIEMGGNQEQTGSTDNAKSGETDSDKNPVDQTENAVTGEDTRAGDNDQ